MLSRVVLIPASLSALGDIISQLTLAHHTFESIHETDAKSESDWFSLFLSNYNPNTTLKMFTFGYCFTGPILSRWFRYLERKIPSTVKYSIAKKVILDQITMSPIFMATFLTYNSIWHHDFKKSGIEGIGSEVEDFLTKNYINTVQMGWRVWPAAQIINFTFIPLQWRVPWLGLVSIGWNSYLSSISNIPPQKKNTSFDDIIDVVGIIDQNKDQNDIDPTPPQKLSPA